MKITVANYHRLAKSVGLLLSLTGFGLLAVFANYTLTGANPLAAAPLRLNGAGLLIFASIGAFALPLGMSLFSADSSTSTKLQLAAGALGFMALIRGAAFANPEVRALVGNAPLVEFFVLGSIALLAYFLRPDNEYPIELRTEVELEVAANQAWSVLGEEFGSIGDWASGLRSSSLDRDVEVGALRTCELRAFGPFPSGQIIEELLEFDRDAMNFAYAPTSGMPPMFESATNRWSVESLGAQRCRVRSHASIDLQWWALPLAKFFGRGIRSEIDAFAEEMRHRIEKGVAHPRKLAQAEVGRS
jgi:hypothetical protein